MKIVFLLAVFIVPLLMLFSVFFRVTVTHPISTVRYIITDTINYFRYRHFDLMKTGKLVCYTALFGGGKTLSCVHYVNHLYNRYNDKRVFDISRKKWVTQKVHVISNVDLTIPYEHFDSLGQIVRVADKFREMDEENNTLTCTVVLGDEFSVQMNSREFKTNIDPLFLNTLLTCRHHHIMMIYNAQRFKHVDALLRQVTSYVVECHKVWRVVIQKEYDAFELENSSDPTVVKSKARHGWFIRDRDYNSYDTLACVGNLKKSVEKGDMESPIEILNRQAPRDIDLGSFNRQKKIARISRRRRR